MSTYPADLADRFAAMRPEPVESDWLDVQRRARASRKRHLIAYALAATFAIVLVGCTAAFGPRIVSFADSEQSPPHVLDELTVDRANLEDEDPGFPGFEEGDARRVIERQFAGSPIAVDVTPLRRGGFCLAIDRYDDGGRIGPACFTPARLGKEPLGFIPVDGSDGLTDGKHEGGVTSLLGWFSHPDVTRVDLRYEDGTTARLDHFRVTKPIDTAFFLFDVPEGNESYPRRAAELRALNDDGKVIARVSTLPSDPDEWTFPRTPLSEGDTHHGFPPAADASRERRLVFPGSDLRVWVAPARGGATCFIVHTLQGSGSDLCTHDRASREMFALDADRIEPWESVTHLWGLTEPNVRQVDLRFQDGRRDTTVPQAGLVVYAIPGRQYEIGKRLVAATLRDANGKVVRRIAFDPTVRDRYPCDNPKSDIELGPEHCP